MTAPDDFGTRLRALRESKGLTQVQLADLADMSSNAVAMLERGERRPSWDTVLALCRVLKVQCTAFTEGAAEGDATPKRTARRKQR
jgi:transcriptional regulator with XRE-family HTH domain